MSVAQKAKNSTSPPAADGVEPGARPTTRRDVALIAAFVLVLLAPFVTKPLHIDDPLFVWCAKHISSDPLDFYNFAINWYGYEELMYMVTQNPPLTCYYLAAAGALFGWSEAVLHTAMAIPAVLSAVGAYYLARRACGQPLLATLIGAATPAFIVSSTTLMCDVMMLAFWCWAVVAWLKGCDERQPVWLYASALLVTLASLTKYYAVCLIPLLVAYTLYRYFVERPTDSRGRPVARSQPPAWYHLAGALALAVALLTAFEVGTQLWYGIGLLSRAMLYAQQKSAEDEGYNRRTLIGVAMLGGCVPVALFYVHRMWSWLVGLGILAAAALLTAIYAVGDNLDSVLSDLTIFSSQALAPQFVAYFVTGLLCLALGLIDFFRRRDAMSLLLVLWLLGTYAFAGFVNWTTNARSVLPAAPVVGILIVRQIERRDGAKATARRAAPAPGFWRSALVRDYGPLVPAVILTLVVGWADMQSARAARAAAEDLARKYSEPPLMWFQGHWGFQYYMDQQPLPANAFNLRGTPMKAGNPLIVPLNNTNAYLPDDLRARLIKIEDYKSDSCSFATTMYSGTAGLYSNGFGPLPYVFGRTGPETYFVFRAKNDFTVAPLAGVDKRQPPDSPALRKYIRIHGHPPMKIIAPVKEAAPENGAAPAKEAAPAK